MSDKSYDILINIDARVQAIQEAVTQTQRLVHEASGLEKAFGFAGVIELTHRLAEVITEIPKALFEGVKVGIEFNSEVQDLQTNIAGVLRLTQSDQFGSFAAAKAAAPFRTARRVGLMRPLRREFMPWASTTFRSSRQLLPDDVET